MNRYRTDTRPRLGLLAFLIGCACSLPAGAETLDFAQCVRTALQQNPDLMGSQQRVVQAQAGLRQAKGYGMPKLTASLNAMGTNDALNAFGIKLSQRGATFNDFGAGQFNPQNPNVLSIAPYALNNPGFVHNFDTRLQLDIPVYTGGMVSGGIRQAAAYIAAAQSGDRAARQQVIFQVLQAYDGVHAARAYLDVARQAELAARSELKMMESMEKSGTIIKSDLLLAQVRLQDVQVDESQAENAVAGALDQLRMLLGLAPDAPVDVAGPAEVRPMGEPLPELRRLAMDNNPGIQALRHKVDADTANVDVARAANKPQLGFMLRQDWNDAQLGFNANSYTIGGSLSWTAFDGGLTNGKIDQAQASRNETFARLQQAEAGIAVQVADAQRKATEAEQRLTQRELAVTQMEEAVRLVNKRYANGVATITEQLGTQAQLDKARADVVSARYDLAIQRARLKLATGQLDPDTL
ncbi:MAG: TolC family protein [Betaproteobacteria bacterium]|nr:TolC family protein [Betaproteobacteria bacterium]